MAGSLDALHPAALADYRAAFRRPSVRAAMINDYQTGCCIDVEHDRADRTAGHTISCLVLSLWASERLVAESTSAASLSASAVWRRWADDVSGIVVPGGHLIPEHAATYVVHSVTALINDAEITSSNL